LPVVPAVATDRYYLNQEIGDYLRIAEEAAPHLLRLYTIGTSYEGRPLLMAEITNRATGEGHEKPAIWLDGGWRGGQLLGSSACLEVIRQLLSHYGRDPVISDLLDNVTFYCCPRLAADAADLSLLSGEWCWSSTRAPLSAPSGLRPADVNGDGRVLQMRVLDPLGPWKVSRRDARLMVARSPEDRQGPFYRLMPEGLANEGEPMQPTGPRSHLDLEKNFPGSWAWDGQEMGPYPLSEPETRVVADFFRTHPNLALAVSFGNLEPGISLTQVGSSEAPLWRRMARKLKEWSGLQVNHHQQPGYLRWAYESHSLMVIKVSPWSLARASGLEGDGLDEPEQASILRWLDRECPGAFHPWMPYEHPQLGQVDVGGWDWLYSWLNPPPGGLLMGELERFTKVVLGAAQALPRLHVEEFSESTVGWSEFAPPDAASGEFLPLRKLNVVVENRGFLPTGSAPLQLQLWLEPGQQLILGKERVELSGLQGVGLSEGEMALPYVSGQSIPARVEHQWLVQGNGRIQLEARHSRAGVRLVTAGLERTRQSAEAPPVPLAPPSYSAPLPPPPPPPAPPRAPGPRTPSAPLAAPPPAPTPARTMPPSARPAPPPPPTPPVQQPAAVAPAALPQRQPAAVAPAALPQRPPAPTRPPTPLAAPPAAPPTPATPPAPPTPPAAQPAASAPVPASPERGRRVLGSPPPKPGAPVSSFAARAQELVQRQEAPKPASDGFEPFSPGLPIKPAFPGRPIEPPPSVDFEDTTTPQEHPPVMTPLLLRRERRP
jgi:hypothetical protein